MTRMHNPAHPGQILTDTVLSSEGAGLSVTEFAQRLGVSVPQTQAVYACAKLLDRTSSKMN